MELDLSLALRKPSEMRALVEAIWHKDFRVEPDWLEWKGLVDLRLAEWQFRVGRFILGAANRNPDKSAQTVEGCAYLVLGVEPGHVHGLDPVDSARLEDTISPYLGRTGPRWSPHYIELDGQTVLVIVVEAPHWGDQIRTLRKGFNSFHSGRVFIRRTGQTAEASAEEMDMLQDRASRTRQPLELDVEWISEPVIRAIVLNEDAQQRWLQAERQSMLRISPPSLPELLGMTTSPLSEHGDVKLSIEAEEYLARIAQLLPAKARYEAVQQRIGLLQARVDNLTDRNFSDVLVEMDVYGEVAAFFTARDAEPEEGFPRRPEPLVGLAAGFAHFDYSALAIGGGPQGITDNTENGTRIVFRPPVHLRPRYDRDLDPFCLIVSEEYASQAIELIWVATSTGVDGQAQGKLTVSVDSAPLTLEELFGTSKR